MRILLVGETDLSHGSLLERLGAALAARDGISVRTLAIPAANRVEARLVAHFRRLGDLDLQPLRWQLRESWRARRLLHGSQDADVVLINTQASALLARAVMRRVPTVVSLDCTTRQFAGLEYWRPRGRTAVVGERALEALERRALHGAAAVLAWTHWAGSSVRDDYGVPVERVAEIHPGVDTVRWSVDRAATDDGSPLQVLFVGNTVARKGLPTLLEALPVVDRPLRLDVVSEDPDVVADDERVTVHRGLRAGSPALVERFARADVLVLPTLADVSPWVIAEAMMAGLAVIATTVGAIPEMLGDGAGVLVARDDPPAVAAALRELADNPDHRRALGDRARRRALDRYDSDRQIEQIVELLRAAAERRPVPTPQP